MKKILDLRFVIGAFFTIVGLLLFGYSFTHDGQWNLNQAIGWGNKYNEFKTVNRWCGVAFTVFGIVMILLSFVKDADDELTEEGI